MTKHQNGQDTENLSVESCGSQTTNSLMVGCWGMSLGIREEKGHPREQQKGYPREQEKRYLREREKM